MPKDFTIIYKILKTLIAWRGREQFDVALISAQTMGIAYEDWEQLMIELQEDGYIKGLVTTQTLSDMFPHIVEPIRPRITMKGIEFVNDNSLMKKAAEVLKSLGEIIP